MIIAGGSKNLLEMGPVAHLSLDQFHARRQKIAASMAQVVVNNGLMTVFAQISRNGTSDVSCTAGN